MLQCSKLWPSGDGYYNSLGTGLEGRATGTD